MQCRESPLTARRGVLCRDRTGIDGALPDATLVASPVRHALPGRGSHAGLCPAASHDWLDASPERSHERSVCGAVSDGECCAAGGAACEVATNSRDTGYFMRVVTGPGWRGGA
eukprot:143998-Prymnesium_polylepis.1